MLRISAFTLARIRRKRSPFLHAAAHHSFLRLRPDADPQDGQLFFETRIGFTNAGRDKGQLGGRPGSREAWCGGHEGTTVLRHPESGCQFGDTAFIDPALGVTDAAERKPADKTGSDSEGDSTSDASVELHGDAVAGFQQPLDPVDHCSMSRSVSMG